MKSIFQLFPSRNKVQMGEENRYSGRYVNVHLPQLTTLVFRAFKVLPVDRYYFSTSIWLAVVYSSICSHYKFSYVTHSDD